MPRGVYLRKAHIVKGCLYCGKEFTTIPSLQRIKYCSWNCYTNAEKGKHWSPKTQFKKGLIPWCTGTKGRIKAWNKGKKLPQFSGKKNPNWKGGKIIRAGYILVYKPKHPFCNSQGYIRKHRLVVEKQIGRYLFPQEQVHHLGEKDDNRPNMLIVFSSNSTHRKFHGDPLKVKPSEIIFDGRNIK